MDNNPDLISKSKSFLFFQYLNLFLVILVFVALMLFKRYFNLISSIYIIYLGLGFMIFSKHLGNSLYLTGKKISPQIEEKQIVLWTQLVSIPVGIFFILVGLSKILF